MWAAYARHLVVPKRGKRPRLTTPQPNATIGKNNRERVNAPQKAAGLARLLQNAAAHHHLPFLAAFALHRLQDHHRPFSRIFAE